MIRVISTLFLALASATAITPVVAVAQTAQKNSPIEIADNAPDSYTVVRGDTLWGISGKFLKQPWRWPEVWHMNKDQIRNPHWIYPGQVIVLDRNGPTLSIRGANGASGSGKMEPQIYSTPADIAISSIPMKVIQQFLAEPLFSDVADSNSLPTVVAMQNQRVIAGTEDTIYAKGITGSDEVWQIYRRAKPINEPVTGELLGYESAYVGKARVVTAGSGDVASEMRVTLSKQDISMGDRLQPQIKDSTMSFVPHAPDASTTARIASIYDSLNEAAGRYNIITLTKGSNDGIEPGHVFALYSNKGTASYAGDGRRETYTLPDKRYGLVFVFRVFNRVSYALVLDSSEPVSVGDEVRAP